MAHAKCAELERSLSAAQDENHALKVKIAHLEQELLNQRDCYKCLAQELQYVEQRHGYERTRSFMLERSNEEIVNQQLADLVECRGERDELKQRHAALKKKLKEKERQAAERETNLREEHTITLEHVRTTWKRIHQ